MFVLLIVVELLTILFKPSFNILCIHYDIFHLQTLVEALEYRSKN